MFVGIDDTDALSGMCTTYLASKLCSKLGVAKNPRLIRLNPNIPYRTRGNGAVAFETEGDAERVEETVLSYVKKYAMLGDDNTNPGVVLFDSDRVTPEVEDFYRRAVSELVSLEEAERVAAGVGARVHKFKNGRGVIGALAAIGFTGDVTYELIAYRNPRNCGRPRRVNADSVFRMDERFFPRVFDSVDRETNQVLVTPRGNDPVLCGIRGVGPEVLASAWGVIECSEPADSTQLFITNQATDAHLRRKKIDEIRPYDCVTVSGTVSNPPKTIEGGHVVFTLSDHNSSIDCAAYKPTGSFRDVVRRLRLGDEATVQGGIGKYAGTLNLEKIRVDSLAETYEKERPVCCGRKMTSAGKGSAVKCRVCGKTSEESLKPADRELDVCVYDVPPRARRHLSRPGFLD